MSESVGGDQIQIGNHTVSAEDVARVLGKTGTLGDRFVARIRLSRSLGDWSIMGTFHETGRELLGKKLAGVNVEAIIKIAGAYERALQDTYGKELKEKPSDFEATEEMQQICERGFNSFSCS